MKKKIPQSRNLSRVKKSKYTEVWNDRFGVTVNRTISRELGNLSGVEFNEKDGSFVILFKYWSFFLVLMDRKMGMIDFSVGFVRGFQGRIGNFRLLLVIWVFLLRKYIWAVGGKGMFTEEVTQWSARYMVVRWC